MKSINVIFEDEDYEKLEKAKGELGWREFILTLIKKEKTGD
ncbi:hypothetical protein LCGC14_1862240 [marine sediment metagenome]|uniref:Uncharacterized protein n=1 Tax=marine sediment metagenome TaxID=412755 RepID=A0A0F9G7J7_9ZZZZ